MSNARAISAMTAESARALANDVKFEVVARWAKMLSLYEGGAHTVPDYPNWHTYCAAEFDVAQARAYRFVQAAQVKVITKMDNKPIPESVARELVPLRDQPVELRETWEGVVAEFDKPTAQVRQVVQRRKAPAPPGPTPNVEDLGQFDSLFGGLLGFAHLVEREGDALIERLGRAPVDRRREWRKQTIRSARALRARSTALNAGARPRAVPSAGDAEAAAVEQPGGTRERGDDWTAPVSKRAKIVLLDNHRRVA